MTFNQDVYSFDLLRNGAAVAEVTLNSSHSYLQRLLANNLVTIEGDKVYLTDKGEAAKKIGVEKYLLLEKYEQKIMRWNTKNRKRDLKFLRLAALLIFVLVLILFYINFLLT